MLIVRSGAALVAPLLLVPWGPIGLCALEAIANIVLSG